MNDSKFLALVTKAKNRNKKAFARLCELKVNEVIFLCVREMGNQQDGQDAAQEVFIQLQKSLPNLQAPEAFNVWLNRLVHNTCNSMKRKTLRHNDMLKTEAFEDFLMDETLVTLQENMELADDRRRVVSIIDSLPDKYRSCVVMHYYQNLSYAQIAEVLEISTDAVNNNMRMARKFIKRELEGEKAPKAVGMLPALAVGPLLAKSMAEAATTAVSAVAAKQCLAAAGVYTAFSTGAGAAAGIAGGVAVKAAAAKAATAVVGVALAVTAGTGIYTVATGSSQPSSPEPAAVLASGSPQGREDGAAVGSGGEDIPLGGLMAGDILAAGTNNALSGRIYVKHGDEADPQAYSGLEGAALQLVMADDADTVLASVAVAGGPENGVFTLAGMPDGDYKLRVILPAGAMVSDTSPARLKSGLLDTNNWLEWAGETSFTLENGQTQMTGLDLEVELETRLRGHLTLYFGGALVAYDDGLLPGIYMELYDPQGCKIASSPITAEGEYEFINPMIGQSGSYTLHVTADDTAPWALDIEDEQIDLTPGYIS